MMSGMVDEEELRRRCEEITAAVPTVEEWAAAARAFGELVGVSLRASMSDAIRPLQEASGPALAAAMDAMHEAGRELAEPRLREA